MKGHDDIIDILNDVLTGELTAVNQYFIHHKMCENWGLHRLSDYIRHESIDEMKHADRLISRILYLECIPNLQRLYKVNVGETVPEQLKLDLDLEKVALERLQKGIARAVELSDNGSRALLEEILVSEEEHVDWLEAQLDQIEQIGLPNYLSVQVRKEG
ncbi:MAG: bacterioferritin [Myxococcota bacterium]